MADPTVTVQREAIFAELQADLSELESAVLLTEESLKLIQDGAELAPQAMGVRFGVVNTVRVTNALRAHVRASTLGTAFAQALESLSIACDKYWCVYKLSLPSTPREIQLRQPTHIPSTIQELYELFIGGSDFKRFSEKSVTDKLRELETLLGLSIPFTTELNSLKQARNCLVHRFGIVGLRDIDQTSRVMDLQFREMCLCVCHTDGRETRLDTNTVFPFVVEPGDTVSLELGSLRKRAFALGERINLEMTDFSACMYMCSQICLVLHSRICQLSQP